MADLTYAYCHSCTKEAKGHDKIFTLFGFRNYQGKVYVQSHCKKCRSREQKLRQQKGLERPWH